MKTDIDNTAASCIFCGSKARCVHYEADLWYYEYSNKECDKHPHYAYMGFRASSAKEQWNWANRKMKGVNGRNKNDEDFNL